jgi:hypothetical protein
MTDMGEAAMPGGVVSEPTHLRDFRFTRSKLGGRMGDL